MNDNINKAHDTVHCEHNDANLEKSVDEIFKLMNSYEAMVINIQDDAKIFREENRILRESLESIIEENNQLKSNKSDSISSFRTDYINVADRIFNSLRNQLFLLNQEKEMFESLWKKTASVLEKEVPINSVNKLKTEHSLEVMRLKEELLACQTSFKKQNTINKILQENLKMMVNKFKRNQVLIDEKDKELEKLMNISSEKEELAKLLEDMNQLNKEQMDKSSETFDKLQESILVAEQAMAEVNNLLTEKEQIQDEYNNLAHTIGSVIESAAEKVDIEVANLKMDHQRNMEKSLIEIDNLKMIIELEHSKTEAANQKAYAAEDKLNSTINANSFLENDLQIAFQTIAETEQKLSNLEHTIATEQESNNYCVYKATQLQKIIENNRQNKEKWKVLIMEITKKLEEKIKKLILENYELRKKCNA